MNHQEQRLQEQFATWLDSLGVLHCASLAGVNLGKMAAIRMKRKGYRRGYPDTAILEPRGPYHGLFVELKVQNTTKNEAQEHWQKELEKRGYKVLKVPGSFDFWQAREWLEKETTEFLKI